MTVFWLIVSVAVLALLQIIYYNKRALKNVDYTCRFSKERAYAGDKVEFIEVLSNKKLIPIPWVRVEGKISPWLRFGNQENFDVSLEQFHKSVFFLGSYSRITRRHAVTCLRRGCYDCRLVSVTGGDLFGVSHVSRDFTCPAKLIVYPAAAPAEELPREALNWQGEASVRRWIMPDPVLITGIREYRYGDNRRDVHWGATAKTGVMQVKTRDYTVCPRLLLLLNTQISENLWNGMEPEAVEFLENGVSIAAALALWAYEHGMEVGLKSNGSCVLSPGSAVSVPIERSANQLEAIFEALAALEIKMQTPFASFLDGLAGSGVSMLDIVIISAYNSEKISQCSDRLRAMGNSVTFIPIEGGGKK